MMKCTLPELDSNRPYCLHQVTWWHENLWALSASIYPQEHGLITEKQLQVDQWQQFLQCLGCSSTAPRSLWLYSQCTQPCISGGPPIMYSSKTDNGIADQEWVWSLLVLLLHCQVCAFLLALNYSTAQLGGLWQTPHLFNRMAWNAAMGAHINYYPLVLSSIGGDAIGAQ